MGSTENTLDELPENVRPHVEPMVGRMAIKLPQGVGDLLLYVPNKEEIHEHVRDVRGKRPAARGATPKRPPPKLARRAKPRRARPK